jgi:hypothetical protein
VWLDTNIRSENLSIFLNRHLLITGRLGWLWSISMTDMTSSFVVVFRDS